MTTQWAIQNSVNSERSDEVRGSTDCATSAGFIGTSLSAQSGPVRRTGAAQYPQSTCARRCRPRAKSQTECFANSYVPSTGELRNPRETWPNLGAEAGFSALNSADYG